MTRGAIIILALSCAVGCVQMDRALLREVPAPVAQGQTNSETILEPRPEVIAATRIVGTGMEPFVPGAAAGASAVGILIGGYAAWRNRQRKAKP